MRALARPRRIVQWATALPWLATAFDQGFAGWPRGPTVVVMLSSRAELERLIGLSAFGGLLLEVRERVPGGVTRTLTWYSDAARKLSSREGDADAVLADVDWLLAQVPELKITRALAGGSDAETAAAVEQYAATQDASRQDSGPLSGVDADLNVRWRRLLVQQLVEHRGLPPDEASGLLATVRALVRPRVHARWLVLQQVGRGSEVLLSFDAYPTSWRTDESVLMNQVSRAARLLHWPQPPAPGGGSPARPPTPAPTRPSEQRKATPPPASAPPH